MSSPKKRRTMHGAKRRRQSLRNGGTIYTKAPWPVPGKAGSDAQAVRSGEEAR